MTGRHTVSAALISGVMPSALFPELSNPEPGNWPKSGSGKSSSPWSRMHWEKATAFSSCWTCCALTSCWGARAISSLKTLAQAWRAWAKPGWVKFTPASCMAARKEAWSTICELSMSGKSGKPSSRMQREKSTNASSRSWNSSSSDSSSCGCSSSAWAGTSVSATSAFSAGCGWSGVGSGVGSAGGLANRSRASNKPSGSNSLRSVAATSLVSLPVVPQAATASATTTAAPASRVRFEMGRRLLMSPPSRIIGGRCLRLPRPSRRQRGRTLRAGPGCG